MKLRPYQIEAVEALRNNKKGIIAAATGSGKTTMMAASIHEKSHRGKVLVLVHLQHLVIQTAERITNETGLRVGQYFERQNDSYQDFDVLVATWQSLNKLTATDAISKTAFYSINVDEAHHVSGKYFDTVTYFNSEFLHGYTATPYGPGEEILFEVFGDVIYSIDIFELIEKGYLSKFDMKVYRSAVKKLNPELNSEYHQRKDEYIRETERQLRKENRTPKFVHFFKNNKHINEFHEAALKSRTGVYTSMTYKRARDKLLKKFNNESECLNHLYSIRMLDEGVDIPIINGLVFHEHAGNFRTFTQRLGRGLRVYNNAEHITYINQFVDYDDEDTISSLASFQRETETAMNLRKGKEEDYIDYVKIELDKDTYSFLEEYKKRAAEKAEKERISIAYCGRCGRNFFTRKRNLDMLRKGDELLCNSCQPGGGVESTCSTCGEKVVVKQAKYRLYADSNSKIFCSTHSRSKNKSITIKCDYCGEDFEMLKSAYQIKVKNGQKNFYCSSECHRLKSIKKVNCSVCGKEFEMKCGEYNKKIKRGDKFYCIEHKICYKNRTRKSEKVVLIKTLSCVVCGKEEPIKKRTFEMYQKKQTTFLCQEHKYHRQGSIVRCYNCGEEMEVSNVKFNEYHRKGLNFHCPDCKGVIGR